MNEDIKALLSKAQESLAAAKLLRSQGYHGFAASRAYYAMFYVAEALLASLGQSFSSHGGVIGAFGREFAKTEKLDPKFHRWLIDGQDARNVGDYGVGVEITEDQANELVDHADEFIRIVHEYIEAESKQDL